MFKILLVVLLVFGAFTLVSAGEFGYNSLDLKIIETPISFETYTEKPDRASEDNMHGGLLTLGTAETVNPTTNATVDQGIGKTLIVVNTASDSAGTLYVTGTKVDRVTGEVTAGYTDAVTISGVSTDTSLNDGNGNLVHQFSDAYLTNVWFSGSLIYWTTDLNMADIDVHHVSFEQMNDQNGIKINTFDANLLATHINAEYDAYLYTLVKDGSTGKVTITNASSLHLGTDGVTPIANKYYRLRSGNLGVELDGNRDGIWVDVFYANSPAYVEDVTIKVWGSQEVKV